jgi:hypothetical protein
LAPVLMAVYGAGTAQAGSGPALPCSPFGSSRSLWAAADFNGDHSVELVRVNVGRAGDRVLSSGVEFFAFCENSLPPLVDSFSQIGLVLSARDIDADRDQDLVLRDRFAGKAIVVWLNDGMGGFAEGEPADFSRAGEDLPGVERHASPFREPAASLSSKSCASMAGIGDPSRFSPRSPGRAIETPTHVTPGWRDARQSRGPPSLSR